MCFTFCSTVDRRSGWGAEEQPGHHHSGLLQLPQPVWFLQGGRHQRQEWLSGDDGKLLSLTVLVLLTPCFCFLFPLFLFNGGTTTEVIAGRKTAQECVNPHRTAASAPLFPFVFPACHECGGHTGGRPRHGAADRGRNPALGEHHFQGSRQLRCRGEWGVWVESHKNTTVATGWTV